MPASTDDLAGDVVHHLLGALESDLSTRAFDPFQSIFLPSDENLLEAMASWQSRNRFLKQSSFSCVKLLKK